jgi:hypothetical protein
MSDEKLPAGDDTARVTAVVLRTLFPGVSPGPMVKPYPLAVATAIEWQNAGASATFSELYGTLAGAPQGRTSELVGRIASAGEQLGLAWTAEQDARRWLEPGQRRGGWDVAARSLAEVTGYYAMSAGHGLANVTVRTLLLHADSAAVLNEKYRRAKGFVPYDSNPPDVAATQQGGGRGARGRSRGSAAALGDPSGEPCTPPRPTSALDGFD